MIYDGLNAADVVAVHVIRNYCVCYNCAIVGQIVNKQLTHVSTLRCHLQGEITKSAFFWIIYLIDLNITE